MTVCKELVIVLEKGCGFRTTLLLNNLDEDLRQVLHVVDWHIIVITRSVTYVWMVSNTTVRCRSRLRVKRE